MDDEMMDIGPQYDPEGWIRGKRAETRLTWLMLLFELLDNAFDAGAKVVVVTMDRDQITVADDGCGCANLKVMLTPGKRADHTTTFTGRYAIGGKEAMCILADEVVIESRVADKVRTVKVDYGQVMRSGSWKIPPASERFNSGGGTGTKIILRRLQKKMPSNLEQLTASLGRVYAPMLRSARAQIQIIRKNRAETVNPEDYPDMEQMVKREFHLANGRVLHLTAGLIVNKDQRSLRGVTLANRNRVLCFGTKIGLNGAIVPNLYVYCQLEGRGWVLDKNKVDVSEHDRDIIADVIRRELVDLIELAKKAADEISVRHINNILQRLPDRLGQLRKRDAKARRVRTDNHPGAVEPKKTGRRHNQAAREQEGSTVFSKHQQRAEGKGSFKIYYTEQGEADPLFAMDGDYAVSINTAHPAYQKCNKLGADFGMMALLFAHGHHSLLETKGWLKTDLHLENSAATYQQTVSMLVESYADEATLGKKADPGAVA